MGPRLAFGVIMIAGLAMLAGACSTAPSHFYTLDPTAAPGTAAGAPISVVVGPVSVPDAVDRPEFVVQVAANQVNVEEFNRWASPLNDSIARAVAGDLSAQLGTQEVAVGPMANYSPAYRVTIDVQRFESVRGQYALIEALWTVHRISSGKTKSGRSIAREPVEGDSFAALAAAHSRALARISADIAAAIRSEAARSTAG